MIRVALERLNVRIGIPNIIPASVKGIPVDLLLLAEIAYEVSKVIAPFCVFNVFKENFNTSFWN